MTELLPCPFCGGEARIIDKPYEPKVCVGCDDDTCLGFSGLGWLYDSEQEAAEAWNRRAERTCRDTSNEPPYASDFECSSCGFAYSMSDDMSMLPDEIKYCPNCGAKVVDECGR